MKEDHLLWLHINRYCEDTTTAHTTLERANVAAKASKLWPITTTLVYFDVRWFDQIAKEDIDG